MRHTRFEQMPLNEGQTFGLLLKGSTAMAVAALAVAGSFAPDVVQSGITWGQGLVALAGGALGAILALHR